MCLIISEMKMLRKCFLFAFLLSYSLTVAHAQDDPDQTGFISIDCGLAEGSDYTDRTTGIYYRSDAELISSGESKSISSNSQEKYLSTVRSFPQGNRNCYTLKPSLGKAGKYLIRASFLYENYDGRNQLPVFNLNLGASTWDTITFYDQSTTVTKEIIHIPSSDYIHVCLVKTGLGTPFISALELRPLNRSKDMYPTSSGSLNLVARINFDSTATQVVRYKDDIYDRMWSPFTLDNTTTIISSSDINYNPNYYELPSAVTRSACTPDNASNPLYFYWTTDNATDIFYIYFHFAEVVQLQANQSREFNIYINQKLWSTNSVVVPSRVRVFTFYSVLPKTGELKYEVSMNKTNDSTLPPIINAFELYSVKLLSILETDKTDVDAIISIKSVYGVTTRDWQGDPCVPEAFVWDGLNCSYNGFDPARIISLDLSKSGLTGGIAPSIANLTKLKSLDLSNNKLIGIVPDFLSHLTSLTFLNLKGNNFTKPLPAQLLENSNSGLLTLIIDDPAPNPCESPPCKKKKSKSSNLPVVAAGVAGVVVLLGLILFGIWMIRRRKQRVRKVDIAESHRMEGELERKDRQFSYSEVLNITNNFQRILGKGGFGTVYHGYVGDTQVAVKMLSPSSAQGYREFQAEARLLMTVHHKNLSSLVGYCNEGTNMGIIYEYMANGNLHEHLSGRSSTVLGWEKRLLIAMDAAQGLEYLHHGCKPPIIHRDVKTSNILLTEKFQAKLADFGLSRACPVEGGSTHVSTSVAGTPGYLDPEYYASNRLIEKSDVYGFGIVLLEIITGRPAIVKNQDKTHIVQWVDSNVRNGDVKQVVDPRFRGDFDVNSVWKAVELAMTCASHNSAKRPTMNLVVLELKECLAIEISSHDTESKNSFGLVSMNLETDLGPLAR